MSVSTASQTPDADADADTQAGRKTSKRGEAGGGIGRASVQSRKGKDGHGVQSCQVVCGERLPGGRNLRRGVPIHHMVSERSERNDRESEGSEHGDFPNTAPRRPRALGFAFFASRPPPPPGKEGVVGGRKGEERLDISSLASALPFTDPSANCWNE